MTDGNIRGCAILLLVLLGFTLYAHHSCNKACNAPQKPVDYRTAETADWVLRANTDIQAALGDATICDLWNAQVMTDPRQAAIWVKTTNAHTQAVTFYKLIYKINPDGTATCIEDRTVPGYPNR
jgi:hypothetical protein